MTLKSDINNSAGRLVDEIERRVEELPDQARDVQKNLVGWGHRARQYAKRNPGKVVMGAFALGFLLAKVSRRE